MTTENLNLGPHPFYAAVNKVLDAHHFDTFAEGLCAKFYDDPAKGGRPGLAPGVYFRCLMIGYFEGIDSERGIAWRCSEGGDRQITFLALDFGRGGGDLPAAANKTNPD